jgi:L-lactate dehydrogenase complex protein LldG
MDSRSEILSALRRNLPPATELPPLQETWITYDDPRAQFRAALEAVGGRVLTAASIDQAQDQLQQLPAWTEARQRCSVVPGIQQADVELDAVDDPHQLSELDFAILPGSFAVAENGAVWVDDPRIKHRAVTFITQHLALVVPSDQIVHNMHQAYDRLRFASAGFGLFVAGPSKTADIEQSLVIGAHGARSLTVLLLDGSA